MNRVWYTGHESRHAHRAGGGPDTVHAQVVDEVDRYPLPVGPLDETLHALIAPPGNKGDRLGKKWFGEGFHS